MPTGRGTSYPDRSIVYDYQGLLIDADNIATWENYVSQTIDV